MATSFQDIWPQSHINDHYENNVAHPTNPWRRHPAQHDPHDSSRRYDKRNIQNHYHPMVMHDHDCNDASKVVKQLHVDGLRHCHPINSRNYYLQTRDRAPPSQISRIIHQIDSGYSFGLDGDLRDPGDSDVFPRSQRHSFGSRRPCYFINESKSLKSDNILPISHPDLTIIGISVQNVRRQISEQHYPSDTIGISTA